MSESKNRICILGGGFGGLYTALRLSQLPWDHYGIPEIILVDQRDRFLFTPLLYELLTGELQTWEIAPPFT
ncbi:MAG: NAD(P)/FAD-dependent oxidoreductase, partial [Cyanobacteria bacterium]|nr:NAD(P)/FAD-dependent oxidoreductase [Cyanobacteria bacterium GSL.Bin21]